jgi:TPR repeat protein
MKSRVFRATLQALLAVSVLGASLATRADEVAADLQAGIDAFNRGDLPGAMTLYEKAAEAGSAEAQVRLAYLLDYAEDNEKAVHWYRAAADQDYAEGIAGLAEMYAKGEGVEQDKKEVRVLISAYEKGGLDVEKDASLAAYWRDKQASLNDSDN